MRPASNLSSRSARASTHTGRRNSGSSRSALQSREAGPDRAGDSTVTDDLGGSSPASADADEIESNNETLVALASTLRALRQRRKLTLQDLATQTGLSMSMLSMVERGRASPSIGSLVAIASALDVHMSSLFLTDEADGRNPVRRFDDQPLIETAAGVLRRLAIVDEEQNVEVAVNEYPPKTASAGTPLHHQGYEYGIVLAGALTVELDGVQHELRPGDAIGYNSTTTHRLSNTGSRRAKALWINIGRQ